jgi:Sulfotransferase domain
MKLICIGMHRTGTLSVKVALEKLGFGPVYHGYELAGRPEQASLWQEAIDTGGRIDWSRIFGEYPVIMDWPMLGFWEQVTAFYPEAKVLLTVRDPESWFDSHAELLGTIFERVANESHPASSEVNAVLGRVIGDKFAPNDPLDKEAAIKVFEQHYENVRATVSSDQFIEYHVREGWEPLCRLLRVAVPDESFPYVNARQVAYENIISAIKRTSRLSQDLDWL